MTIVGLGNSTLDDITRDVLKEHGRTVTADPEPEKGFFYRSDHFEFAKQGVPVPALNARSGVEIIGQPGGFGLKKRDEYVTEDYHKVTDEIKPGWDLSGMAEDAELLFAVGLDVANGTERPEWKTGSEFKARR